ncbi:hypothetical protein E2P81_ATG06998 [Venturia nashicola]|uniref:Uncharacterized protein n=1 Tax=Venturia nashicola TaxID=86259 RepID=A0A4Z1NYX3_9PEZI|nr:hypothetical protein E6O75_ATG07164 [Venturia nashicola]TLD19381.1 hypothetical protein E2P81_ATG06998 [Venturia nashicola]
MLPLCGGIKIWQTSADTERQTPADTERQTSADTERQAYPRLRELAICLEFTGEDILCLPGWQKIGRSKMHEITQYPVVDEDS